MRRRWYGRDTGLMLRMAFTMGALVVLLLAFLAFIHALGAGAGVMLVSTAVFLLAQYALSDRLVLWSTGSRIVGDDEAPELHRMLTRLAALVDLPVPRLGIVDTPVPNAFATGRSPGHSAVVVTTGLLRRLDATEVEAVLAHELAHIKNRDVMVITLASFLPTLASALMRILVWSGRPLRNDRRLEAGSYLVTLLVVALTWLFSVVLVQTLSRYREFSADRGSALITGSPSALASALIRISHDVALIPERDLREVQGANAFFIVPAVKGNNLIGLFASHPPLEKRLARLRQMELDAERAAWES